MTTSALREDEPPAYRTRVLGPRGAARDIIKTALAAAGTGPERRQPAPWHFVVVSDPETKRRIRIAAEAEG